jgi:hypothetical protein
MIVNHTLPRSLNNNHKGTLQFEAYLYNNISRLKGHKNVYSRRRFTKYLPKCCQKQLPSQKKPNIKIKAQLESPKCLHQTDFETLNYLQQTMF